MFNMGILVSNLKNGFLAFKLKVIIKKSRYIISILDVLLYEGYILGYTIQEFNIIVYLKYINGKSVINDIKLISKPVRRVYFSFKKLRKFSELNETIFFTTNKGIKSNKDYCLLKNGQGGEGIFFIK